MGDWSLSHILSAVLGVSEGLRCHVHPWFCVLGWCAC